MKKIATFLGLTASLATIHTYMAWLNTNFAGTAPVICIGMMALIAALILLWDDW